MKKNIFISLGLMSGTSMDGVDLSIIKSDGISKVEPLYDKYFEFDDNLHDELIDLRELLSISHDLKNYSKKIREIEKKFTIFNAKIINEAVDKSGIQIDLIGFHGQTVLHLPEERISEQIGDGNLLSQLSKCIVVNRFRQNDLDNGGQGAPLTPVFHNLISKKLNEYFNLNYPIDIINIGGITNVSRIVIDGNIEQNVFAYDVAPGNCLIDEWLRKNSNLKYDKNGEIANSGRVNDLIYNQAVESFEIISIKESLDVKSFDLSFVKGLTLEDGCATITKFTAHLIYEGLKKVDRLNSLKTNNYIVCGGGRKNKTLIKNINKLMNKEGSVLKNIDKFKINGDFVESQAFAYLAIRSLLDLPISFPNTTRCNAPISGGTIIKNF